MAEAFAEKPDKTKKERKESTFRSFMCFCRLNDTSEPRFTSFAEMMRNDAFFSVVS